jgi:hypothetical protein
VFNHYGGECICCGLADTAFLTIDHINNDGHLDKKSGNRYKKIIDAGVFRPICNYFVGTVIVGNLLMAAFVLMKVEELCGVYTLHSSSE